VGDQKGKSKADNDSRQRDNVRNDPVLKVDENDHHLGTAKQEEDGENQARPEFKKKRQGKRAVQKFDERVLKRDLFPATAAPSPKPKVA
jgi:hypothetical protein